MNRGRTKRKLFDGRRLRVGIVIADFNYAITEKMLAEAMRTLRQYKVLEKNVTILHVAGSFEIPYALQHLARTKKYDCLTGIGCIVKGITIHDKVLGHAVTQAILRVSLDEHIPIGLGVITVNNLAQARTRVSRGGDAVRAALELARLGGNKR